MLPYRMSMTIKRFPSNNNFAPLSKCFQIIEFIVSQSFCYVYTHWFLHLPPPTDFICTYFILHSPCLLPCVLCEHMTFILYFFVFSSFFFLFLHFLYRIKFHGWDAEIGIFYHLVIVCIRMMRDLSQRTSLNKVHIHYKSNLYKSGTMGYVIIRIIFISII